MPLKKSFVPEKLGDLPARKVQAQLMSATRCKICTSPERAAIEADMLNPDLGSPTIAEKWGLTKQSVLKHKNDHLIPVVQRAMAKKESPAEMEDRILAKVEALQARTERYLGESELADAPYKRAPLLKAALDAVQLEAQLTGRLGPNATVAVNAEKALLIMPRASDFPGLLEELQAQQEQN